MTNDGPHLPLSHGVGFWGDRVVMSFNVKKRKFHLASVYPYTTNGTGIYAAPLTPLAPPLA